MRWDVPLLDGYPHEFVPNTAPDPGTHHFRGLRNPGLVRRIAAWRPDAVLLTAYNHESVVLFLAAWRGRTPVLFRGDSHRLVERHGLKEPMRRATLGLLLRRFDACLFVGRANLQYFRRHGVAARRLFFSPHAVDNERFQGAAETTRVEACEWRRSLGIPAHHRVVLFAGKFEEKKRPLDLLEAYRRAALPDTSLLFVGSGKLEAKLRCAARSVASVFFAPFQNQSLMPRTYASADLFVLPSFGPHETWGLAVNEAMCLGVPPVVSSHVGCGPDLVRDGVNGRVFEAGNRESLAAALQDALSDPDRLGLWGRRCQRRIQGYSYGKATAGLLKALRCVGAGG
jgi:glycosyltransferase involved in cell wall biosynthesis